MEHVDWRWLWVAGAGLCLAAAPLLAWLLSKERTPQYAAQQDSAAGMDGVHWTRARALRNPLFWLMVPALLGPPAFNTALFFHQVHLAEIKGWEHIQFVSFFPLYTAMAIGAMLVSGWALDRWGSARLMPFFHLPMIAAFLTFAGASQPAALAVAFFFMALTSGAMQTLPNAFWAEFYGTAHIGSIKAMAAAVMVLGSAIGPGLTGWLIDLGFGLERQFVAMAGYFVLTTLVMLVGIGRARHRLQRPAGVAAAE